jgi:hypothetical protein
VKRGILILSIVFVTVFRPSLSRAETHVYVTFSIGGAVVVGAGVVAWSFSYSSQVSEHKPSQESPGRLFLTMISSESGPLRMIQDGQNRLPQFIPQISEIATRLSNGPRAVSTVEVPLFILRW